MTEDVRLHRLVGPQLHVGQQPPLTAARRSGESELGTQPLADVGDRGIRLGCPTRHEGVDVLHPVDQSSVTSTFAFLAMSAKRSALSCRVS